jgi:integrase
MPAVGAARCRAAQSRPRAGAQCQAADEIFPTSLAVSANANVKAVQPMLGHAKASRTLDIYADLFDEDLDAAIQATADEFQCLVRIECSDLVKCGG